MFRSASLAAALAAAIATCFGPVAYAQAQSGPSPQGQIQQGQPGGQAAGNEAQERSRGAVGGWLWPFLGLAVIGGVVAAAAGSGGGGGGSGGGSSAPAGTR
jgi:hypothetical protein